MDIYKNLTESYTVGKPLLSDEKYDEFEDIINIATGTRPDGHILIEESSDNKVRLPKTLLSQSKLKNSKDFDRWFNSNSFGRDTVFNISSKLDGISILLFGDEAYTRGDGTFGQNVTWLKTALKLSNPPNGIMIRGELIISKSGWDDLKDDTTITNPLSFVAGYANSKTPDLDFVKYLNFVGFQWVDWNSTIERAPSEQHILIEQHGYQRVNSSVKTKLEWGTMQDILDQFRLDSNYILDGIIITEDIQHQRVDDKNPPYSRAFKDFVTIDSIVTEIKWKVSKYGTLKPRIFFEPVEVDGKTYKKATGHNAAIIKEYNIGVGAKITIGIKIIPSFLSMDELGDDYQFPSDSMMIGRELIATDKTQASQAIKSIESFIIGIGVTGFKSGGVTKVYNAGYKTVDLILRMTKDEMRKSLGPNKGETVYNDIQRQYNMASDETLFVASGFFPGIAIKKADTIFDQISLPEIVAGELCLRKIDGVGDKTTNIIMEGLDDFFDWILSLPSRKNISKRVAKSERVGIYTIMTGSPPDPHSKESFAKTYGLIKTDSWKDAKLLLTNSHDSTTKKMMQATQRSIPIKTYEEFANL